MSGKMFSTAEIVGQYDHFPYGLVCAGSREYAIKTQSGKKESTFGNLVCKNSGFMKALFVGTRKQYLQFLRKSFGKEVQRYFR